MNPVGLILIAIGLPGAIWPYNVARFQEQMDSIGSTRPWHEVEPAEWRVFLTRILSVGMCLIGLFVLFFR